MPTVRRRRTAWLVSLSMVALTACGSSATPSSGPTGSGPAPVPVPKAGHAYLGAFVNPRHGGLSEKGVPGSNVTSQLPGFEKAVGHPVGILHFYMPFADPLPVATLTAVEKAGSIPMISWGCTNVAAVSAGRDDTTITRFATELRSFGKPVLLRWYWEMNQSTVGGRTPAGSGCDGYNNGSGYIAAWRHIYELFQAAHASNVAFVWCPGYSGGNQAAYYPGDQYVTWIAEDRYERTKNGGPLLDFSVMISDFYQQWSSHAKPLMIAETGALGASDQQRYLASILAQARQFPDVKAVVWFDSTGPYGNWALQGQGLSEFATLARSAYFSG